MVRLLLVVIYLTFISLGLPDSLLGVAWPLMRVDFKAPLEAAGLVSMIILGGTILSSFASGAVIKRFPVSKITLISTLMTAAALLGFSFTPAFIVLLLFAIPLGLGAGSIDAALNYYVAKHYRSHHMSWLHCFWGVGATLGPVILSRFIAVQNSWRAGCLAVSVIQWSIAAVLFFSLPLWKVVDREKETAQDEGLAENVKAAEKPLKIKGVNLALIVFLFYCGVEMSVGLWGSSYLISTKGLAPSTAALWVSLYYGGVTLGRFLTGFATFVAGNPALIRTGLMLALSGALLLILPLAPVFSMAGLALLGLGCAPVFPCMIHETPARFGKENSAAIIGYQMGFSYIGSTFLPPLLGVLIAHTTIKIFPFFILGYLAVIVISSERLNQRMKKKGSSRWGLSLLGMGLGLCLCFSTAEAQLSMGVESRTIEDEAVMGGDGKPSEEAIEACSQKKEGEACQTTSFVNGVCRRTQDRLFVSCRAQRQKEWRWN